MCPAVIPRFALIAFRGADGLAAPLADRVCTTETEAAALALLRGLVGGAAGGPMGRHGLRVFLIAKEFARRAAARIGRELLLIAALLHDAGLYRRGPGRRPYVANGRDLVERLLANRGWLTGRIQLCAEAIERHHEPRTQRGRGVEVELLRRADLVDGLPAHPLRYGRDRAWLRDLDARVPLDGFHRELGCLLFRYARERGIASFLQVFRPEGATGPALAGDNDSR